MSISNERSLDLFIRQTYPARSYYLTLLSIMGGNMEYLATGLVALVAIEHAYFLVLEMFLWTKPSTLKAFGITREEAETSKTLAANQGLYNGFLSAGLIWGLVHSNAAFALQIQTFFLGCVLVAAIYGGATAKKTILFIQGGPALAALCALYFL